jgi:hypothetical protein
VIESFSGIAVVERNPMYAVYRVGTPMPEATAPLAAIH